MTILSNWTHVDIFTVNQASALWCEFDPAKLSTVVSQNPSEVLAIKQLLSGCIGDKSLTADSSKNGLAIIGDYSTSLVTRTELERIAQSKKLFPKFLFDTLAPFANPSEKLTVPRPPIVQAEKSRPKSLVKNTGGRPTEYDWDSFTMEIIRIANTPDGLPDAQAELIRSMQQWFLDKFQQEPAESSIKSKVSKIYRYLEQVKN